MMHHTSVLLTEVHGKRLLREGMLPVPTGYEVRDVAELSGLDLTFPVAVKAQVSGGGRGLAGGVVRCETRDDLESAFNQVTSLSYGGSPAESVLVEPWLQIEREVYLSVTVDATTGGFVALYSPTGGVHVEDGRVWRYDVGLPRDFRGSRMRELLADAEPDSRVLNGVVALTRRLLELAAAYDCTTIEINPLVCQPGGALVAVDAKVVVDDSAHFRSAWITGLLTEAAAQEPAPVRACLDLGIAVVWLDGNVGLISSGAGMTMAAMDTLASAGGTAACFLDVSGNPTPAGFAAAFDLLRDSPQVDAILVSVFGGGMHVDRVARTLAQVLGQRPLGKPLTIRLGGTGADAATAELAATGLANQPSLEAAVADVVAQLTMAATT